MNDTGKIISFLPVFLIALNVLGQEGSVNLMLSNPGLKHSLISICITDASSGEVVFEHNPDKSLIPASIQKLITSAAALELLGPEFRFKTVVGYTGTPDRISGRLKGDIIIRGGGDPALGSPNFKQYYGQFADEWISRIKESGIRSIDGRVLSDDSRYDYQPVPAKWLWEDPGNYYGAGVFGLSVMDNTFHIHFRTYSDSTFPEIIRISPAGCGYELSNQLTALGNTDRGYVFTAPYNDKGWIAGTIPSGREDFVLKASIPDPPLLLARVISKKLDSAGISVSGKPSTVRLENKKIEKDFTTITETISPPLREIIEVLNHESVNLYAEHLLKELGKTFLGLGSTSAGLEVISQFMEDCGILSNGMFMVDGSGLSPVNAISSRGMADLLFYMKNDGRYFREFFNSLPDAGKEGTLSGCFTDPVFNSNLKAKSGSMTRVRSYAGYFRASSGKNLVFCIIVNNYSDPSASIINGIEAIVKETILNN